MKILGVCAPVIAALFVLTLDAAEPQPMPRATPASVGLLPAPLDEATELLKRFVAEKKIAGAVAAVARKGKLAYLEPVTAAAVMMLHEAGRFSLTDPVSKYLPEFKEVKVASPDGVTRRPAREITIQDLLLHTSGLSHRSSELYRTARVRVRTDTLPQFITKIVRAPLMEDPGTRYRYSEGPTVLGRLVEIWSGKPFDVFLDERVFKPLGMTETSFWVRPEQRARLAMVYQSARGGGLTPIEIEQEVPFTERPALLEGAVGLVGDSWKIRSSKRTPDGAPHPGMQLNLMSSRLVSLVAQDKSRWPLAGDQLFVDMDLSDANLPAGTQRAIGSAVIEVTSEPHTG